jgi:hypothetical protein
MEVDIKQVSLNMAASDFGHLLDLQHCATVPVDLLHKSVTRTLH